MGAYLKEYGMLLYYRMRNSFLYPVQEVVEAINEFAFVRSDYPLILSIENHCKKSSALLQRMATLFTVTFGDKLMKVPFDDLPVSLVAYM